VKFKQDLAELRTPVTALGTGGADYLTQEQKISTQVNTTVFSMNTFA
jgi:hypothetical protein